MMKINSIQTTTNQPNFRGKLADSAVNFIAKHPVAIAGLASSSVIAQKIVMSGSEATIGPMMDIGIGKVITKATKEKDGRINQSSKSQAIRTCSQSIGGTITGVIIRTACILGCTALLAKAGEKAGGSIAKIINPDGLSKTQNAYEYTKNAQNWGKTIGGALAIGVMMFTNFLIDAPFINWINKKMTAFFDKKQNKEQTVKENVNG